MPEYIHKCSTCSPGNASVNCAQACDGIVTASWRLWAERSRAGACSPSATFAISPPQVIRHAVWLYLRFTLSYRDVEKLLAERGIETSYEEIRRWAPEFGPMFARNLRRLRPRPTGRWHLDEMVITIQGRRMDLWRAVDSEGEVLDLLRL